jgi:hypothetical protein
LWRELQLDRFWADRLSPSRKGTQWDQVLQVLVCYRLISPGSEWKLHRDWFGRSAMADLLGTDFRLAEPHKLFASHDFLLTHKVDLFSHLPSDPKSAAVRIWVLRLQEDGPRQWSKSERIGVIVARAHPRRHGRNGACLTEPQERVVLVG